MHSFFNCNRVCVWLVLVIYGGVSVDGSAFSATSDTLVPVNPGIIGLTNVTFNSTWLGAVAVPFTPAGCSEKVSVWTQTMPYTGENSTIPGQAAAIAPDLSSWPRVNCPHLDPSLQPFESIFPSPTPESDITLAAGQSLLLNANSLPAASQTDPTWILNRITVPFNTSLVIDDSPLLLRVREIKVASGGSLLIGSENCRYFSKIQIWFHGNGSNSARPDRPETAAWPSKGMIVAGRVDMHGKLFHPTWTRLARTTGTPFASPAARNILNDSSIIYLQEAVNWEVGQQIVITTTIQLDCHPKFQQWCQPCDWQPSNNYHLCSSVTHQNEVRTIIGLAQAPNLPSNSTIQFTALQLDRGLNYTHYGGIEYQAEVALLSRRIEMIGEESFDYFGGHSMVMGKLGQGKFSGIRAEAMGQKNVLARYPFHFHLMNQTAGSAQSYMQDCSVTNSYFRAYTIHGSNLTRLSRNIAFNVTGMAYYLESGNEENNLLEYNLAAWIQPIMKWAAGSYSQTGETNIANMSTPIEADQILTPIDTTASGFYSLNGYNVWVGNTASGGWASYAFPMVTCPIGVNGSACVGVYDPSQRPIKKFIGNTAHSNGYQWIENGSGVYMGATLSYLADGFTLQYNSGKNFRVQNPAAKFEHTKAFMTNKGIANWANTYILNAEMHDCRFSSMVFGYSTLVNVLTNGRTPNRGYSAADMFNIGRVQTGFQFYDTWIEIIISGLIMRHYNDSTHKAMRYLDTAGDLYPNQGLNAVRGMVFDGITPQHRLGISACGTWCGGAPNGVETWKSLLAHRIYNVWDTDGSFTGTNVPTIMGSHFDWWNVGPEANSTYDNITGIWHTPWTTSITIGYIAPGVPGFMEGCDVAKFGTAQYTGCYAGFYPNTVGRISQFNDWGQPDYRAINLTSFPSVTGIVNTGWYWRTIAPEYGINGAPSQFEIGQNVQIERGNFVVLAVAYPPNTTFDIHLQSDPTWGWWKNSSDHSQGYMTWSLPNLNFTQIITPNETINHYNTFNCPGGAFSFCNFNSTGSVGPGWYFDGQHLYLRIVTLDFYNKQQGSVYDSPTQFYSMGGIHVPKTLGGFKYIVNANCSGCAIQGTRGSTIFYDTPDVAPSFRFPVQVGTLRPLPNYTNPDELAQFAAPQCQAYTAQPQSSSSSSTGGMISSSSSSTGTPSSSSTPASSSSTGSSSSGVSSSGAVSSSSVASSSSSSGAGAASSSGSSSGASSSAASSSAHSSSSSTGGGSSSGTGASVSSSSSTGGVVSSSSSSAASSSSSAAPSSSSASPSSSSSSSAPSSSSGVASSSSSNSGVPSSSSSVPSSSTAPASSSAGSSSTVSNSCTGVTASSSSSIPSSSGSSSHSSSTLASSTSSPSSSSAAVSSSSAGSTNAPMSSSSSGSSSHSSSSTSTGPSGGSSSGSSASSTPSSTKVSSSSSGPVASSSTSSPSSTATSTGTNSTSSTSTASASGQQLQVGGTSSGAAIDASTLSTNGSSALSTGALAGVIVCGVVLLGLVSTGGVWYYRARGRSSVHTQAQYKSDEMNESPHAHHHPPTSPSSAWTHGNVSPGVMSHQIDITPI